MKRMLACLSLLCLALFSLAACGSPASSSLPASSSAPSSAASQSAASSLPPAESDSTLAEGMYDVEELLVPIAEAAALGNTIDLTQLEITASGDVDASLIVAMAGAQSTLYNDNGGMAAVLQAAPGEAETLKTQLEAYRDGLLAQSENYQSDFPLAYENMKNAVIYVNGDYVVFATAAGGDVAALTSGIEAAFA